MSPEELAQAYQQFFFKSEAGKTFMDTLQSMEAGHINQAQKLNDLAELSKSAGIKEVLENIHSVIAQVANQPE